MTGFINFIRKQGVVGLAVGFILGTSVAKVVSSLVQDIIQPVLALVLGGPGGLNAAAFSFFGATVKYGSFIAAVIDFLIIAAVVYYGVKALRLDRLDVKKES